MRRAVAGLVVALAGCASVHSSLSAEIDADYDATHAYEARCLTRGGAGQLLGVTLDFEEGHREGARVIAVEDDIALWGQGRTASGVPYLYGQLCAGPRACADYLYFEDDHRRLWLKVETVRPAETPEVLAEQLQEGQLIDQAAALLAGSKPLETFLRVATELESAESTRNSVFSYLFGVGALVTEISASVTAASATVDAQLLLTPLMSFLNQHTVQLIGGRGGDELRGFEVVRTICAAPRSAVAPIALLERTP